MKPGDHELWIRRRETAGRGDRRTKRSLRRDEFTKRGKQLVTYSVLKVLFRGLRVELRHRDRIHVGPLFLTPSPSDFTLGDSHQRLWLRVCFHWVYEETGRKLCFQ